MSQSSIDNRFRDFFEKNTSVMFLIDPKSSEILDANLSAASFYGYPREKLIGMKISEINTLAPEKIREELDLAVIEKRNYFKFEHRLSSNEIKNVEVHSTPIHTDTGIVIFSIVHDVTDRTIAESKVKTLLDEKEILLREVHHRIKNNMSMIHSLLDLQIGSLKDPSAKSALTDAAGRVQSMAMLYDKLYLTQEYGLVSLSQYLNSLTDQIISNFPNRASVTLTKRLEELDLDGNYLQYLGIIMNEILTNIMKYAFLPGRKGNIEIVGRLVSDDYHLSIRDDGLGMPDSIDFDHPKSFGLTLIQFLSNRLKAKVEIERGNGTIIHLTIPFKTL
jgi:PAS domain S-box-containing protein